MIPAPLSVLGLCTGSDRSLSRTLSTVERLHSQSSHANPRLPYLRSWKYLLHLPTRPFFPRILHRKLQKAIQYPGIRSGSVQCILSEVLRPDHSVAPHRSPAGALPIECFSLSP